MYTPEMRGRVVLITGASSGIGKDTAVGIAGRGATTVLVSRDLARTEAAAEEVRALTGNDDVHALRADMGCKAEILAMAEAFQARWGRLDVLINNAGAVYMQRTVTADGHEASFGVNHLGYHLTTMALLPCLGAGGRIVNVSSDAHWLSWVRWGDLEGERLYLGLVNYCTSKLFNLWFTFELARRLQGTGIAVNALHPGAVASGFGRNQESRGSWYGLGVTLARPALRTTGRAAQTSIYLASSPEVEGVSGRYFASSKEHFCSFQAKSKSSAARLWTLTEQITGLGIPARPAPEGRG